ncbi:FeoB-associated Cys-rich membrane protein [Neobacillus muris]|nr:FeoB-associated Cys-rich membrane protein [Neobacillus muris]
MVNLIIGLAIFSLAARLLYKNIQKSKQGSCPSM